MFLGYKGYFNRNMGGSSSSFLERLCIASDMRGVFNVVWMKTTMSNTK